MNGKVGCRFLFYIAFENFKMKIFTMKNQGIKQMMGGGPKKAKNPKIQQKKPNSGISGHFGSALQNLHFFFISNAFSLYHITGASAHVPVYMHIRLLVAAYLFQTGYGHTCYAFFKADYSFSRIMKVMFRLSFLTTPLCWVMNRPYQFYYFVPLCAFWFTLYYCWLWIPFFRPEKLGADNGPQVLKLMTLKVVCFVGLIILMFLNADWFQMAFSVWPLQ